MAALYYGISCNMTAVVCGAPQYYIGDYLDTREHHPILKAIMGDLSKESIEKLNVVIKNTIVNGNNSDTIVFLHYSPLEHTYEEHIKDLVYDLKKCGYGLVEDNNYSYKEHSQVGKYFGSFLWNVYTQYL